MSAVGEYGFPVRPRGRAARGSFPRLISDRMAYADALRQWGAEEARRLALAFAWGRYGEDDARAELAVWLARYAERSGMAAGAIRAEDLPSCRVLAVEMLNEEIARIDEAWKPVLERMVQAAQREDSREAQVRAAGEIAREAKVPPYVIGHAVRWARWRRRHPGRGGG